MKTQSFVETPTTHDRRASVEFYEKLGFRELDSSQDGFLTDGKVVVALRSERTARTAVALCKNWGPVLPRISRLTKVIPDPGGEICADPNGVRVKLCPPAEFEISGVSTSGLGNFVGLSIESTDCEKTAMFWEGLGYELHSGSLDQGWISLEQDGFVGISIMAAGTCPHLFFSPGLTFFNSGRNLEIIAGIRSKGISITEEITSFNPDGVTDNVVLLDPGGTGFFVFND